jgi:eukaryotic-like serine/threonine-protein kinase
MSDLVGRTVSHYKILDHLGSGGMGVVYKAEDTKLRRIVALKFLPPDLMRDPEAKQRFLHEARASSSLQHPNICIVYDIDETEDEQMFISMECIEGKTLKECIEGGPLSIQESIKIASQIASGLARAHEAGVVHRDLKPANVIAGRDGSVKILDFGLAKSGSSPLITGTGNTLGTAAYMSPEQVRGDTVDQRTDIWSLGVILYEMVTGVRPFPSEYAQAAIYAVINQRHPPIHSAQPDVPDALEKLIDRCLEKRAAERFHDAGALLEALRHIETGPREKNEPATRSIAVLPFADISPDQDNKYFSDGLTEEIITRLSRLQKVRILSRSSVMHYERGVKTTRQIAAELNVQYLLEGSVRKHGTSLRITTQLIDASQDAYLWAETYNGTMEEIFDIQEDVASRIVKALKVRLTPDDRRTLKRRATVNTGAYQLYLKGRYFWSKRTTEGIQTAIRHFEEAIEKDPLFAPAWAGIADSYIISTEFPNLSRQEMYAKAKAAARRALEIDDRLAEAHSSLGLLAMMNEWDWPKAEKEFRLAISGSPNYATAHHWFAELLLCQGKTKESLAEISLAVELDPLSPAALKDKGVLHYYARVYDGAIEYARKALELDANFAGAHRILSLAYQATGKHTEAIAEHDLWSTKIARTAMRLPAGTPRRGICSRSVRRGRPQEETSHGQSLWRISRWANPIRVSPGSNGQSKRALNQWRCCASIRNWTRSGPIRGLDRFWQE